MPATIIVSDYTEEKEMVKLKRIRITQTISPMRVQDSKEGQSIKKLTHESFNLNNYTAHCNTLNV